MSLGHPNPLSYTPRAMYYWLELGRKERMKERYINFNLMTLAAQGKASAINEQKRTLKKAAE